MKVPVVERSLDDGQKLLEGSTMSTAMLPGFTAEAAMGEWSKPYRWRAGDALDRDVGVAPASSCCAPCGKDLCCDECPPDPDPGNRRRFQVLQFRMLM